MEIVLPIELIIKFITTIDQTNKHLDKICQETSI
jgi:hypothetical protein